MLLAWAMHAVLEGHRVENNHVEVVNTNGFDWPSRSELNSNNKCADWATQLSRRQSLPDEAANLLPSASSSHIEIL
jgi:hypothetical protein